MHTAYIQPPGVPPLKVCYIVTYKSCHILGALRTYRIFDENQCREESLLAELQGCHMQIRGELDNFIEARRVESDVSAWKRLKREIDLRRKDIENLKVAISHHQSNLGWGQPGDMGTHDDDLSDHGAGEAAKSEMAIAPETNDTPSVSAMMQSPDPPPAKSPSPCHGGG